jgi:type II secretory pathway component GspD/PulD (secretin)
MKTIETLLLLACLARGVSALAAEPPTNAPARIEPPAQTPTDPADNGEPKSPATNPSPAVAASTDSVATNATQTGPASTNVVSPEAAATNAISMYPTNFPQGGLRMNFRGVPLEMVLNYLSEAAGFIILLETDVKGKVDAWSNQPLNKDEAVNLLNSVLNRNGYAAIRNERTLTIVARDAAKTRDIPVKRGSEPNEIPKTDEMVTQIVPIRYINAAQLIKDLQPLLPLNSQLTANEAGNALVITDTQSNIRRMAEIVKALDTSLSSYSTIRVYPLKYADAKTVATVVKDLFQSQDSGQRTGADLRAQFFQRMRGGGGGPVGMPGFGGGGDQGAGGGGGRAQAPKVVATSDDRSNSLVVSAPEEMITTIDELVKAVDVNVEDVTEVKVFRLKYADPVEMADLLAGLFPDDTRSDTGNNRNNVRFGGGGFGGFGGMRQGNNAAGQQSDRMKKMGRVIAVPDQRTSSVVVSASRDLMTQIEQMIVQLDSNPAKKQQVYVYSLENADVQEVEQILRNMFDRNGTMNSRNSTSQQNSRLNTRSTQTQTTTSGLGNSGSGGSRGVGGGGLGGSSF